MRTRLFLSCCAVAFAGLLTACSGGDGSSSPPPSSSQTPNILFVVMDDVGIDQMQIFGYGGVTPPSMPNMAVIANAGIRFRNAWSMPECSPGRASFFVGRYPFRTNIYSALGTYDLANAQVSPYDMTTPKLLKQANYESAMFGKFHLAGPDNNQAGNGTPMQLGWDYFYGWIRGGPASLDTTGGGGNPNPTGNPYVCGFAPSAAAGGADRGACYQPDNSCKAITGVNSGGDVPGKQCLMSGGVFVPNATCQTTPPSGLDFTKANGYYVSPLVINSAAGGVQAIPNTDSRNRGYRTTIETDAAIGWIKSRSSSKPWMATISYSAAHTPYQQPPGSLVKGGPNDDLSCSDLIQQRVVSNKMTEAIDTASLNLMPTKSSWSNAMLQNYNSLLASLNGILASQPPCNGDANIDGQVNSDDLSVWQQFVSWALSSIADFNFDGLTNNTDAQIIRSNQGTCAKATAVY